MRKKTLGSESESDSPEKKKKNYFSQENTLRLIIFSLYHAADYLTNIYTTYICYTWWHQCKVQQVLHLLHMVAPMQGPAGITSATHGGTNARSSRYYICYTWWHQCKVQQVISLVNRLWFAWYFHQGLTSRMMVADLTEILQSENEVLWGIAFLSGIFVVLMAGIFSCKLALGDKYLARSGTVVRYFLCAIPMGLLQGITYKLAYHRYIRRKHVTGDFASSSDGCPYEVQNLF